MIRDGACCKLPVMAITAAKHPSEGQLQACGELQWQRKAAEQWCKQRLNA